MASIAELNVRLGLIYKDFDRGMAQVERTLRTSGQRLSALGSDLTAAISLPLAAFGAGAIKAAGEMESLQLAMRSTFESGGRSIAEADKELEALRKSALAPGLDFEQAVKASIRLQGVGLEAENARKTIEQLANAISMTGGTAANLESVTVQMTQMISKGRVLAQDLRIIQENMPVISKLMKQAFGTSNAEDLQKLGITGKEFVDKITVEMAKLPRVAGGLQNAIVNAGSAIKQFLAGIGAEIAKAFNLTAKSEEFSKWLQDAAMWFKNLDDGVKKSIVQFGLFVVALGPVIKVFSILQSTGAATIGFFRTMLGALKGVIGGTVNAISAFAKMNTALKLTVIGAAVAAVLALVAVFNELSSSVSTAVKIQREVDNVTVSANQSIVEQKNRVEELTGIIKSHNATQQQRKDAMAELNRISPEYFGNLKMEKGLVAGLKEAQDAYIESLLRTALVKAAEEKIAQLQRERLDIQDQLNKSTATGAQTAGNATKELLYRIVDLTGAFSKLAGTDFASNQMSDQIENFGRLTGESFALEERLKGVIKANTDWGNVTRSTNQDLDNANKLTGDHTKKVKEVETEYDGAIRRVKMLASEYLKLASAVFVKPLPTIGSTKGKPVGEQTASGFDFAAVESMTAGKNTAEAIAAAMTKAKIAIDSTKDSLSALATVVANTNGGPMAQMQVLLEGIQARTGFIGDAMAAAAGAIASAAASGASSLGEFANAALEAAASVARMLIIEAALRAANAAIKNGGIFGAIAAVAIGGLVAGGLSALVNSIKIPAHEKGTLNAPGGLSLVGEGGPELVNLRPGSQVFPNSLLKQMAGGGMGGTLTARVAGSDLLFIVERAQNRAKRTRGF